ncbi:MAG: glycosyltransferase [Armatimonadetes bacterium]|nr:glycosyltransferase [Armatimonadota bacterium]
MKKIFMFTSVHNWNDTRIFYKEAVSLAKKYEVELHAPADFDFKEENSVKIYGLPRWYKVSERKKIRKEIWQRINKTDADIFHFHDPELVFMGMLLKIFKKKKVIYDIHENYYTSILLKKWIPTKYLRKIVALLFSFIEKFSCSFFDAIIFAEIYYKNNFSNKHIMKSVDVLNYPLLKKIESKKSKDNVTKIIYTGGVTVERGTINMINGVKELIKRKINAKLYLVGYLNDENIISIIENNTKLNENVVIIGKREFVDRLVIDKEYLSADIGLALISSKEHYEKKLLTKFFEYMQNQIPIIISNYQNWEKLINETNCGLCVDPLNPKEIADAIEYIINNPEIAKQMGKNGRKAVEEKFNWKNEEKKLFKIYKEILK